MTPIRRLAWTSLALVALVGCDVGVSTPVTPPTPPTTGGTAGGANGGTAGASSSEPKAPTEIKPMPVEPGKTDEKKPEGAAVEKLSDDELAQIKKLPADEQAAAIAQAVCPVSEHHLGGGNMGAPIKQTIGDKTFYICCGGCKDEVKENPDKVLANLAKLKK
jgi:hypothetical protein